MKQDIINILNALKTTDIPADLKENDISLVMFTSRNAAVNFVFIKDEKQPRYTVKFISRDELKPLSRVGYDVLSRIHKTKNDYLKKTTPVPLASGEIGRYFYTVETAVNHMLLSRYMRINRKKTERIVEVFDNVNKWLSGLYGCFDLTYCPGNELEKNKDIQNALVVIRRENGLNESKKDRITEIFAELKNYSDVRLPLVVRHGDFSSWNMKFDEKEKNVHVFDWEYVNPSGFPLIDLLNFSVISQPLIDGSNKMRGAMKAGLFSGNTDMALPDLAAFEKTFYIESWFLNIVKKTVLNYCEKLGIERKFLKALFLICILIHLSRDKRILDMFLDRGLPKWCR